MRKLAALLVAAALPAAAGAQPAQPARVEPSDALMAMVRQGNFVDAEREASGLVNQCFAEHKDGKPCVDLAAVHMITLAKLARPESEKTLLDAFGFIERSAGADDDTTFIALSAITAYYDNRQDVGKAVPWFKRRMDMAIRRSGPRSKDGVEAVVGYTTALFANDRAGEGIPLLAPYTDLPATTPDQKLLLGEVLSMLGQLYRATSQPREAEPHMRRAHAMFVDAGGETSPRAAEELGDLASLLRFNGKLVEAQALGKRALAILPASSPARSLLDWVEGAAGPGGREAQLRAALAEAERIGGFRGMPAVLAASQLGDFLLSSGRAADAKPYIDRVATAAEDPANSPGVRANFFVIVSGAYLRIGQPASAAAQWEKAVALMRAQPGYNQERLLTYEGMLGSFYTMSGRSAAGRGYAMAAGNRLLARLATYRDFDAAAQAELRENATTFRTHVQANWALAHR